MSEPLRRIKAPVRLAFEIAAGIALTRFLRAIAEGRFLGQRCVSCLKVYVPPRGVCPTCGLLLGEVVPVADTGTLTTFCIVNVPYEGQTMKLPYVYGSILLDGADIPFPHLVQGLPVPEVRMGLRLKAVWAPPEGRKPTMESILWFSPTGEPDAPFEAYREHL
ncbi:MAG: Zn-ribbon domain-containing OB-fold protein [Minicystis sp.]